MDLAVTEERIREVQTGSVYRGEYLNSSANIFRGLGASRTKDLYKVAVTHAPAGDRVS